MQPLASLKALADPIYEAFYGLTEQPFAITTDPKFFYLSASHERAFSELLNGLRRREGVTLVTGETGTGKTTLARAVIDALGERTFSALILNPYMTGAEVLRIVLRDFGLVSHDDLRRGALSSADVPQLLDTLEGFLQSLVPLGAHAVIILDEAQSLAPQVLDQIRLLTGLEQKGQRLVQIVLCGQPGLLATLKTEPMYALNERITRRIALAPLPSEEVRGYIDHRLAVAGGADAVRFEPAAARVVADLAHGLPRRINVLCDRALQESRIEGVRTVTPDLVTRAARALAGVHDPAPAAPSPPSAHPSVESPASTLGMLTLGQVEPKPGRLRRLVFLGIGAIVTATALGYGYYAYETVRWAPALMPHAPAAPLRDVGVPATNLRVPNADELKAMFGRPSPAPAAARANVTEVPPPGTPAAVAPSPKTPDKSDQLH